MNDRGTTRMGKIFGTGLTTFVLALLVALPLGTSLTAGGGPSVRASVNGWQ
ncbi:MULTISPECIES: hypothetical protein [Streptomyces]|uniref:Uncharacterized protein n=3 Tax=Streptomyces rochei group TaxID=2867164 RepID=A0AAX3ZL27_STRRO|nr:MULTISPECIES: hypothetical protein [Streptomyces]WDI19576.1 hypothetical protein PS783_19245 [Streptomyces enissocaesilis]MBQ0881925.1 hypothetical protein [Streptomyces sp. RT42]MBQ0916055.1 hypothetical protein [Streptomyces sp. RM99]MBU8550897.1 hypothetical protein [Streptomyces sp. Osf17]MBU8557678.1 hypothetical protein [Streptomyces sp. Babs14]